MKAFYILIGLLSAYAVFVSLQEVKAHLAVGVSLILGSATLSTRFDAKYLVVFRRVLLLLLVSASVCVLVFQLAIAIDPPVIGNRHGTMAIGQVAAATFFGVVGGAVFSLFYLRRGRPEPKYEALIIATSFLVSLLLVASRYLP